MIGHTISHYRIIEEVGRGGMGVVYKAQDLRLGRLVALKFLPPDSSPDEIARFEQEAKAISALNHSAIATIHDVGEVEGRRFLVLEFLPGGTLKSRIREHVAENRQFAIDEVVTYGIQIAEGLSSAHHSGIVHRDVKSDNAMLNSDGHLKLTDFGLAKFHDAGQVTRVGSTVGTAAYMSPEQMRGEDVDFRSDLFSLGVVLYELTTTRMPFRGEHEAALAYSIVNEDPVPVQSIRSDVPESLTAIIAKCLEKDPGKRYHTAGEIAEDLRKVNPSGAGQPEARKRRGIPWAAAFAILLAAVLGVYLLMTPSRPSDATGKKSIAVLPFINMSPDPDQEYFSDGLSEELLNVLAKNPGLRVTSRTSSFAFKGTSTDLKTIAAQLQVQHILEGSVRKAGENLRVTAQLIDVETDAHLWSETYNGTMENVFALQDTIAHAVAGVLKIVLTPGEDGAGKRHTDPEAYNAYLLGRHFYEREDDMEKAGRYFRQALSIDSTYAPAWLGLSWTHSFSANAGTVPVDEAYRKARLEVEKALELDPHLAAAHAQVGWIRRRYDWDWNGADQAYQRALQLDPGNAGVLSGAAGLARTLGRYDEAVSLMRRSVELDPVSAHLHNNLGLYSWYAGLPDEACAAYEKCLELSPTYPGTRAFLSGVLLDMGKPDSALRTVLRESSEDWRLYGLALVYHVLGRSRESDEVLEELVREHRDALAYQIAEIHAYRGHPDQAFQWLDIAYEQRDGGLPSIKGNPNLKSLEKDPRYAEFLKKMKLPE